MLKTLTAVAFFVASAGPALAEPNVILITLDGVRFQDFFGGVRKRTPLFPRLHASARDGDAWLFGDGGKGGVFRVANEVAVSLPGYRAILSGEFEDRCRGNGCANIDRETIFDGLADLGFSRGELAAFASWKEVGLALEKNPGKISRAVARGEYPSAEATAEELEAARKIAHADEVDPTGWGSRRDVHTYSLARLFLAHHRPRFLYLSFLDADEYGHLKRYREYSASLLRYDAWIADLSAELARMGEYGEETSIVITTDHGRGRGPFWAGHGRGIPNSFRTWAAVIPSPRIRAAGGVLPRIAREFSQVDLRPTIEGLLGFGPEELPVRSGQSLVLLKRAGDRRVVHLDR